jgi:hypothetical protein
MFLWRKVGIIGYYVEDIQKAFFTAQLFCSLKKPEED